MRNHHVQQHLDHSNTGNIDINEKNIANSAFPFDENPKSNNRHYKLWTNDISRSNEPTNTEFLEGNITILNKTTLTKVVKIKSKNNEIMKSIQEEPLHHED